MKVLILFIILSFSGVVKAQMLAVMRENFSPTTLPVTFTKYRLENVILPKSYDIPNFIIPPFTTRYTPTLESIAWAENILKKSLKKINKDRPNQPRKKGPVIHKRLKNFQRQYAGYVSQAGEKIIVINAAWRDMVPAHLFYTKFVLAFKVGSYFWQAKVNLDKETIDLLLVSGR